MRPLRTLLTISVASVALSACTDRPNSGPTAPTQLRPSLALGQLPSVCDITLLKSDARAYFAKSTDVGNKIANDLGKLTGSAATEKAFDGLSRMAVVKNTSLMSSTVTADLFDRLAKGWIGCMEAYVRQGVPDVDFAPLLPLGHLFTVRGKNAVDPPGGAYQNGTSNPYWGVEVPAGGSWPNALSASFSKRLLVYEATPPSDFLNTAGAVSRTDIATIPTIASGNLTITLNVGLCEIAGAIPPGLRVNHNNTYGAYVALACLRGTQVAAATRSPFDPRVLAQRAIDFFSPRTLNAAVFAGGLGIGISDASPFGVYDLTAVVLDSLGTITNGDNATPLTVATDFGTPYGKHVVVRARATADSARLQGIPIEMSIQGNSSIIAYFGVGNDSLVTVTRTTDANGYADFGDVRVLKAGGYTLNFRVHFVDTGAQPDVVGGQILLSNSFNIQNRN